MPHETTRVLVCGTVHGGTLPSHKWSVSINGGTDLYMVTYISELGLLTCDCLNYTMSKTKECGHTRVVRKNNLGDASTGGCTYNSFIHGDSPTPGVCPFCKGKLYIVELEGKLL